MPGLSQPFGKICEGVEGGFFPEVGYVRQKDKVLFFFGSRNLTESVGSATIVESINDLELVEKDGEKVIKDGVYVVEGPFQRSDVKNANQRVYPRKIWERLINESSPVMKTVRARGMIGHLEHPKDGRTDGNEGALVVTNLKLKEDGVVWGHAELLDTPKGKILQEYTKKKVRWGVSSRGNGSVDESGMVSDKDYMLETWDAVMRPSTPGAYPTPTKDSKTESANAPVNEGTTTEGKACTAKVRGLVEAAIEGLDEAARLKLVADLIAASGDVNSLAKSKALSTESATELQDWLNKKLRESYEVVVSQKVSAQIDEALNASDEETNSKQAAAFNRVVESMQTRISDAVDEATQVRKKLTETEALLNERTRELEAARTKLAEAVAEKDSFAARLDIASDTIAQLSRKDVGNPIEEAVEEVLKQVPALAEHRTLLEGAESVDRVNELAEALLPVAVAAKPHAPAPVTETVQPTRRSTLPKGLVESESTIKPATTPSVNPSAGARMAGQLVQRMSSGTQKS